MRREDLLNMFLQILDHSDKKSVDAMERFVIAMHAHTVKPSATEITKARSHQPEADRPRAKSATKKK